MGIWLYSMKNTLTSLFLQENRCQRTGIHLILQHFDTRKDCQFTVSLTGIACSMKTGIWLQHEKYMNGIIFLQERQCQRTGIPLILQHFDNIVIIQEKTVNLHVSWTGTACMKTGILLNYSMKTENRVNFLLTGSTLVMTS